MAGRFQEKKSPSTRKSPNTKKKKSGRRIGTVMLCVMLPLLCGLLFGAWMISRLPGFAFLGKRPEQVYVPRTEPAITETEPAQTQLPTEAVTKIATATIGAAGDILMHDLVIESGFDPQTQTYNYDDIFKWFSQSASEVDYLAANLEGTLAGAENNYSGNLVFNAPDEIVDAVKKAGFDLLLTANDHCFDKNYKGFKRTQEVIEERALDHLGTQLGKDDKTYIVRDINGIKVGMTCYTYCSGYTSAKNYIIDGVYLPTEATVRTNAFHYKDLNTFYMKLAGELQEMNADGAEAIVVFVHWGTEYKTTPDALQKKIAQQLCDMGVDVIVGSHSHMAQPVELLTSSTYEGHKTLCVYSTGNSVSNYSGGNTYPAHIEDSMLFTFTLAKYSSGSVMVESADVLPIWMHRYDDEQGVRRFQILTMKDGADWKTEMGLTDELLISCQESADRTMEIVGEGLNAANAWFTQHQKEWETATGIQ